MNIGLGFILFYFIFSLFWFLFLFFSILNLSKKVWYDPSLLSLLLLSWMIMLTRKLANTSFSFTSNYYNNQQKISTIWLMDIEIDTKGHSTTFSVNNSRKLSSYSDISFMNYIDKVKELANNLSWTN